MLARVLVPTTGAVLLQAFAGPPAAGAEVGGPPTRNVIACQPDQRGCTESVVLQEGRLFNGPYELVMYGSEGTGLCGGFDYLRDDLVVSTCDHRLGQGELLRFSGYSYLKGRRGGLTSLVGAAAPTIDSVKVRFRRHRERRWRSPEVISIDGGLQRRLGLDRRQGLFALTIRGCIPAQRLRVVAVDAAGRQVEKFRSPFGKIPC